MRLESRQLPRQLPRHAQLQEDQLLDNARFFPEGEIVDSPGPDSPDPDSPDPDSPDDPDPGGPVRSGITMRLNPMLEGLLRNRLIAVVALVLLGMRQFIGQGLTVGYVVVILLIPLWFTALGRYWGARVLMVLGAIALVSGFWLTELARVDHKVSPALLVSTSVMVLGMLCGVGVILWARLILPLWAVAVSVGAGMLLATIFQSADGNSWKFEYSVPVTVIALAVASRSRRRLFPLVCVLALAAISATHDSRSFFGILIVTAILTLWQFVPAGSRGKRSIVVTCMALVAIGLIAYALGTQLVVDGYLGKEAQARSVSQIQTSGSLLVGGRPEMAASLALFEDRPWGFGSGVVPNLGDISVAKAGMAAINYEPNNGYVENYMFGGQVKLHSVIADSWSHFGLPGIAFAAMITFLSVRAVVKSIAVRRPVALVLFLAVLTFWNLLFSPIYSSAPTLMLTLGLVFLGNGPRERDPMPAVDRDGDTS